VIAALRRSRSLVRPHFWRVISVVLPLAAASDLISSLASSGALSAFGHSLVGEWAGAVVSQLLIAPFFALALVTLFFELRLLHREEASG
jgi:hypothetical protein